jgi:hypothetical protein
MQSPSAKKCERGGYYFFAHHACLYYSDIGPSEQTQLTLVGESVEDDMLNIISSSLVINQWIGL